MLCKEGTELTQVLLQEMFNWSKTCCTSHTYRLLSHRRQIMKTKHTTFLFGLNSACWGILFCLALALSWRPCRNICVLTFIGQCICLCANLLVVWEVTFYCRGHVSGASIWQVLAATGNSMFFFSLENSVPKPLPSQRISCFWLLLFLWFEWMCGRGHQ